MRKYIGKDFVHKGCGLLLDEDASWEKIAYASRKNIRRAESSGISVVKVSGTIAEMNILRAMWYAPEDPNLPTHLHDEDYMFIAYDSEKEPVGCCVLIEVGNHLFLNNLAGNDKGKELRIQDYLLWHCVKYFSGSKYKYIDIGVSYRESLYKFFEKWKVLSYPVIFYKPELAPVITATPFNLSSYQHECDESKIQHAANQLQQLTGKPHTFVPDTAYAKTILTSFGLKEIDRTFHFSTIGSEPCFVDLTLLFSVQFGCLIFNLTVDDEQLWNTYGCLDHFKREIIFTSLSSELPRLSEIKASRKKNWDTLNELFSLEDIHGEHNQETIPSLFYFKSPVGPRFHEKLKEFDVFHSYNVRTNIIGLPIHQNLNTIHMQYLYGIYRGVLNLCSEWVHTENVGAYKKV